MEPNKSEEPTPMPQPTEAQTVVETQLVTETPTPAAPNEPITPTPNQSLQGQPLQEAAAQPGSAATNPIPEPAVNNEAPASTVLGSSPESASSETKTGVAVTQSPKVVEVQPVAKVKSRSRPKITMSPNVKRIILVTTLVVIAAVPSLIFYNKYQASQDKLNSTQSKNPASADLIKRVGELVLVPTDEEPAIATITDITKFKDTIIYQEAKNDDKMLVYSKAKKVVIYRPSIDKVVMTVPLNIDDTQNLSEESQ